MPWDLIFLVAAITLGAVAWFVTAALNGAWSEHPPPLSRRCVVRLDDGAGGTWPVRIGWWVEQPGRPRRWRPWRPRIVREHT